MVQWLVVCAQRINRYFVRVSTLIGYTGITDGFCKTTKHSSHDCLSLINSPFVHESHLLGLLLLCSPSSSCICEGHLLYMKATY